MERTISVRSVRNIRDQLWRWSTLTSLVISVGWTIWQNCCPQYCSFVSCVQEQWPNAWWLRSGLCNRNVLFHWACEISKTSNWNFGWMESTLSFFIATIPLHPGGHWFRTLGSLQIFLQYSFTCSLPALIIWGILVTCCFNIATHHRSTFISIPIMPPSTMDYCNTWKNKQSISPILVMSKVLDCKVKILCRFHFEGPNCNIVVLQVSH